MSTTIEQLAGVADAMHALLIKRANQLANSIIGSADVTEYLTKLSRQVVPHHIPAELLAVRRAPRTFETHRFVELEAIVAT